MEAEATANVSANENSMAEKDVYEQQHEADMEEVRDNERDDEDMNARSQNSKKRRRRRRRKKGATGESARDEDLDKSLEEEKKEEEKPGKERPTSAASRLYLESMKENNAGASESAVTPVKGEGNDDEEDEKTPGSGKRRRRRNRKKKTTLEGDVEDGKKTPNSKPVEPKPTNSTPKGKDQSPRKHGSHSPINHKKRGYETYWSLEKVSEGLKRGELVKGSIRISKRNFELAWVTVQGMKRDVILEGMLPRNRALEGDTVALQLEPRNKWKVMKSELDEHQASLEAASQENEDVEVVSQKLDDTHLTSNSKTSSSSSKNGPPNKPRNADVPEEFLQRTACVVYIIEKRHSRAAGGHLKPFNKKNEVNPDALFSPSDSRLPRLRIPHHCCPPGFFDRPQDFANTLFVARITDWPESSSFDNYFAIGTINRSLGEAGEIMPETEAMFYEYEIDFEPFPEEVLACLPHNQPWVIPDDELAKRRDFRDECVFTIDPLTARDLDDALHCKRLPDGNIEIGVHIADVSYFVRQGTALDEAAQSRATSTYMVQMVVPMLPRRLCEELCSLNPDEDRLTVSVVWTMTEKGEILSDWKGRSVIKSRVKLAYEHAQEMIQKQNKKWEEGELPPMSQGTNVEEISSKVRLLNKIAGQLRRNRFDNGALRLDQVKLQFELDKETGMPLGHHVYQQQDSNRLIEEFMLLANMAVAHHIYTAFPKIALLRRHPKPGQRQLDELVKLCKSHGIQFNAQSSKTIHQSLARFQLGSAKREILVQYAMKPMKNAEYFCAGSVEEESFYHYALSVPFYTHFTSPIRRYADVIVHRLLVASLGLDVKVDERKADLDYIAKHCNDRKLAAKRAGELSNELFFGIFVRECGPLEDDGFVLAVMDQSFDVFMPSLGVTKRIYCKLIQNIKSFNFIKGEDKQPAQLHLVWAASKEEGKDSQGTEKTLTVFSKVRVLLTTESQTEEKGEKNKHVKVFARLIPQNRGAASDVKPKSSNTGSKTIVQQKSEPEDVKKKLFTENAEDGDIKSSDIGGDRVQLNIKDRVQGDKANGSDSDDVIVEEEEILD